MIGKKIEEFVPLMFEACEQQFPRKCNNCGQQFETFKDFLDNTNIPEHAKNNNLQIISQSELRDAVAYRNCSCGTTTTVQCAMNKSHKQELVNAIVEKADELNVDVDEVAQALRDKVIAFAYKDSSDM